MSFWKRLFGKRDSQWQVPIVQEICLAMIQIVPNDWNSVALVLEVPPEGLGSGLHHSAITKEPVKDLKLVNSEFVTPDMSVVNATRKLELGWNERKGTFKRAIILATKDTNGDWEIRSDYEH